MRYEVITDFRGYVVAIRHTNNPLKDIHELDLSQYDLSGNRIRSYKLGKDMLIFDDEEYGRIIATKEKKDAQKEMNELQVKLNETDYISSWTTEQLLDCTNIIEIIKVFSDMKKQYRESITNRKIWRKRIQELKEKLNRSE